jgi:hypothetical protein
MYEGEPAGGLREHIDDEQQQVAHVVRSISFVVWHTRTQNSCVQRKCNGLEADSSHAAVAAKASRSRRTM